jgi:uncharacterized protein YgiM (DUF1202 family)
VRGALLYILFLWLALPGVGEAAELVHKRGKIDRESFVNLRSGPDVSFPSRAVLRKGDEIVVESEEDSWYRVALPDGRKGYVHKTLVSVSGAVEKQSVVRSQPLTAAPPPVVRPPEAIEAKAELPSPAQPSESKAAARGKPLPVIRLLEGKEGEILWWLTAALCVFIIGWICGGNYYLRRDRQRRSKLHF